MKGRLILTICCALLGACGRWTEAQDVIRVEGSTTVGPIAEAFKEAFADLHPEIHCTVKKTGSGDGVAALIDGRCDVAAMSRFMKPDEYERAVRKGVLPTPFAVAMDGVCVIVNPANPVSDLSKEQVKGIFTGRLRNWREVGGPNTPIVPISRDSSSGTYEVFHSIALDHAELGDHVEYANSNPQVSTRVRSTPGAVGYVGLGFVRTGVKAIVYEDVSPSERSITSGKYSLARPLFLFTNGFPEMGSPLYTFCSFYLSEEGQDIVAAKGFIPLTHY